MTSARPIGVCAAVKTAVLNEDSVRLEVKLDLVLTQIATLSSQFDSTLRQEVSERYQKLTDELTEDAENREKHLNAKIKIVTSNVAHQQEQLNAFKTDLIHLNSLIETIKTVDFSYIFKEVLNLGQFKDAIKDIDFFTFNEHYKIILENNNMINGELTKMQFLVVQQEAITAELKMSIASNLHRIRS